MHILRGLHGRRLAGSVATIGNFDGLHIGHQRMLEQLQLESQSRGVPSVVILFEPQPLEYFKPLEAPSRLMTFQQKLRYLRLMNVDYVLCLPFSHKLALMAPEEFITKVLNEQLGVQYLLVGEDFKFGCKRRGNVTLLQRLAEIYHYVCAIAPTATLQGRKVSSTWVREVLECNDFKLAEQLLGRPYAMAGRVIHGQKRGRLIGVPTANILLKQRRLPLQGVFAVRVNVHGDGQHLAGVANVGVRPTVGGNRALLEVHLFNFSGDLYGAELEVIFINKLRNEQRFPSFEALKTQIYKDIKQAKKQLNVS